MRKLRKGFTIPQGCSAACLSAYPYPPMPTPREQPAVSTYDIWLVVAGGSRDGCPLATVELLNTSTK